jgi:FkbM family methyltransferase
MIDVGANIGYHTVLGARLVGPSGRVIAFEPDPENFSLLAANIGRHRLTHVDAVRAAAAAEGGWLTLWRNEENRGDHRTAPHPDARGAVAVPAVTVDGIVSEDAPVTLVKIDVQGGDHEAIRGMERLLTRLRPTVVVEFWPEGVELFGTTAVDVLAYYRSLGATITTVEEPGVGGDDQAILDVVGRQEWRYCNLLLEFP